MKRAVSGITLILLFIGMLTLAFNIEMVEAEPTTIIVPDDYSTIQEAINNANEGDTIYVRNGTYYENVVVNKTVSLIGESKETIVSQNYTDYTVEVRKDNVTVRGFTIQNNLARAPYGIRVNSSSDCQIIDNSAPYGIRVNSSSDCEIIDNRVGPESYLQAGIVVHGGSGNRILKNRIADCSVDGIIVGSSIGNVIMENTMNAHFVGLDLVGSNYNYVYFNHFYVHWSPIACVSLLRSNSNIIEGNTLLETGWEGLCRMELRESCNNSIFHNNFNGLVSSHVSIDESSKNNTWDDGYPSGGNYWIDYDNQDLYSGPYQNETGSDEIGDHPHVINAGNQDNYPIMKPYVDPHDIEITDIVTSKTIVGQGYDLHVNVTITNHGIQTETFNVTVYLNNNLTMPTEDDTEDAWLTEKTINPIQAVDEDWNTYAKGNTSELGWRAYVYENFTVPPVVGGAKWTGKYLTTFSPDWGSSQVDVYCYDHNSESWTQTLSTYATSYEDMIKNWTVTIPDNCLNKTLMVKTELRKRDPFCVGFCPTDWYFEGKVSWLYTNISLPSRKSTTIAFTWDTTGFAKGNYTISAYVTPVPGETDLMDNNFTDGTIAITILGDLNNDRIVDIADVVLVTAVYRSKRGDPEFRPNSDIIEDGVIDVADVVAVTAHYREKDC